MSSELAARPLVAWDAFSLRLDLDMLEYALARLLPRYTQGIRAVRLSGEGDVLEVQVDVALKGIPARLAARLAELRLRRGFLGCRVERLRGPLGVPVPLGLLAMALRRTAPGLLQLDTADAILLVDLREHLPNEVSVGVRDVRCEGRWLHIDLAPGALTPRFDAGPFV
jgi:hypothetical protein